MSSKVIALSVLLLASGAISGASVGCSSSTTTQAAPGPGSSGDGGPQGGDAAEGVDGGDPAPLTGPFIEIPFGAAACPSFSPCGGDVVGMWNVTGGCVKEAVFDAAKAQCPALVASNVKFEARGYVSADGTTLKRRTEVKFHATFAIPASCKAIVPGASCDVTVASFLKSFAQLDEATCVDDAGGGCKCDVGDLTVDDTEDGYTTSGNTLTTASGADKRTYDYCVAGNQVEYSETTAKATPAIYVLQK